VKISLEEEGILLTIREKSGAGGNSIRCTNCIRLGHTTSKYMSKGIMTSLEKYLLDQECTT
jgi:hypothetical protein